MKLMGRGCLFLVKCLSPGGLVTATDDLDAVDDYDIKAPYTKCEYDITMRDGVRLYTDVDTARALLEPYPIMLVRTGYVVLPCGADAYRDPGRKELLLAKEKMVFSYQDVRGRMVSEGTFAHVANRGWSTS